MWDVIVTDRPDFTESATVVGAKARQLETGLTLARGPGSQNLSGPEALLRLGIGSRTELRLGLPNLNQSRQGGASARGIGDTYVGAKLQLGPLRDGTDVALIPALWLPTGARGFTSRAADPEFKLCVGRTLGGAFSLSGMLYVSNPTDPETRHRDTTLQATLSLGQSLRPGVALFYELVHTDPRFGAAERLFHTGIAWQPSPLQQWDIHGGFDVGGFARNAFLGLGYSRKW